MASISWQDKISDKEIFINEYQSNVEDVLTWILGAEEQLQKEDTLEDKSLEIIQQLFHSLERFTTESSEKQAKIKDILSEGQMLISSSICNVDERKEIQLQRNLLSQRWEELRLKIMEKQSQLHHTLMSLQKKQLEEFRVWLTIAEDKISRFSEIGPDLEAIKNQYQEHMVFQNEVKDHEGIVKSLSNMVIIIDECDNPTFSTENLSDDLVDELEALAEKWRHVCSFVEERGNSLEYILNIWQMLEEQEQRFNCWIVKVVKRLQEIEDAVVEMNPKSQFVDSLTKRLDKMEKDVNVQLMYYSEILNKGKHLLEKIDQKSLAAIEIRRKIDLLSAQWDSIMERMNKIGNSIRQLTEMHREQTTATNNNGDNSTDKDSISSDNSQRTKFNNQHSDSDAKLSSDEGAKKRKLDSWKLKEWQKELDGFVEWLEKCECSLGIHSDSGESSLFEQLDVKEQEVLLDETESEMNTGEFETLIERGREIVEELDRFGEEPDSIVAIIDTIEARWCRLKEDLQQKQKKVLAFVSLMRLQSEADAMRRVLDLHVKWLQGEQTALEQFQTSKVGNKDTHVSELNKMFEQCKLRCKSMISQEERVESMSEGSSKILQQYPPFGQEELALDLNDFLDYWQQTNRKLRLFQERLEQLIKSNNIAKRKEEELAEQQPKLVNAIDLFEKWLAKAHKTCALASLKLFFEAESYQEQIDQFRTLEVDIRKEQPNFEYINSTVDKIVQQNSTGSWVPALKNKIRTLNAKWEEAIAGLKEKVQRLEEIRELVPKLEEEIVSFDIWSEEANLFLKESIQFGDLDIMRAQSEQYDALMADIDGAVLTSIDNIKSIYSNVVSIVDADKQKLISLVNEKRDQQTSIEDITNAYEPFKQDYKTRINRIIEMWNEIRHVAKEKKHLLEESIKECEKIIEKIDQFDAEIDTINREKFRCQLDEIDQHFVDLQTISEKLDKNLRSCQKMKSNLLNINGTSNLNANNCLEAIVKKIDTVNEKCCALVEQIQSVIGRRKTIKTLCNDLQQVLMNCQEQLQRLDELLSPKNRPDPADSEEISEQMDNLEHVAGKCSVSDQVAVCVQKIADLGLELESPDGFLVSQWQSLQTKYETRHLELEEHLNDAQHCEHEILDIQAKLNFIESRLSKSSDEQLDVDDSSLQASSMQPFDDTNASQMNQTDQMDIRTLDNQFKNINTQLQSLEDQIELMRNKKHPRSADRLLDQSLLLRNRFQNADRIFQRMKRSLPNNEMSSAMLLDDLKRVYERINQGQLSSAETEMIQRKLIECAQNSPQLAHHIQDLQHRSQHSLGSYSNDLLQAQQSPIAETGAAYRKYSDQEVHPPHHPLYAEPYAECVQEYGQVPMYGNQNYTNGQQQVVDRQEQHYFNQPQSIEIALEQQEHYDDQRFLFRDSVDPPWERALTANHVPYFINHENKNTCWDHPNFLLLQSDLLELNEIRYAAYRTSIKLRTLQQTLFINNIHISNLIRILESFDFLHDSLISVPEIIACLKRIYEDISAKVTPITNMGLLVDLALNWLLNLFDPDRNGFVDLLGFKICLVCLSRSSIEEKYKMLYQLIADSKGYADRQRVATLLGHMLQIPKLLGEIAAFGGSNLEPSIRSCFDTVGNGRTQIDVKHFLCWLKREPQCLVWLPLLHRLIIAESSRHPAKCSVCKAYPLQGFRYKCLKCFNCDLCQQCFLLRSPLPGHKITHPIKEYCCTTSANQDVSDFSQIVRNRFKSSRKSFRKHFTDSYLPVDNLLDTLDRQSQDNGGVALLQYSPLSQNREDMHNDLEFFANRLAQVELQNSATENGSGKIVSEPFTGESRDETFVYGESRSQPVVEAKENSASYGENKLRNGRNSQIRKQNSLRLPNTPAAHQPNKSTDTR